MWIVLRAAAFLLLLFRPETARAQDTQEDPALESFRAGAFAEAMHLWMAQAASGDASAARHVGVLFDIGEGVGQDHVLALAWYRRAAELGDPVAMFNVAVCYDAARGTDRDPASAASWYRRAAASRFGRAEYNLGLMVESGDGIPRDRREAVRLFRAASRDGIAAARARLSGLHDTMNVVPAAPTDDAAERLFVSAQQALLRRTARAAATAARLFARAAQAPGEPGAMARYDLAWCYENGIGVTLDRPHAYALFVRVAAETDDAALRDLARAGADSAGRLHVTASEPAAPASASPPAAPETPGEPPGGQSD